MRGHAHRTALAPVLRQGYRHPLRVQTVPRGRNCVVAAANHPRAGLPQLGPAPATTALCLQSTPRGQALGPGPPFLDAATVRAHAKESCAQAWAEPAAEESREGELLRLLSLGAAPGAAAAADAGERRAATPSAGPGGPGAPHPRPTCLRIAQWAPPRAAARPRRFKPPPARAALHCRAPRRRRRRPPTAPPRAAPADAAPLEAARHSIQGASVLEDCLNSCALFAMDRSGTLSTLSG